VNGISKLYKKHPFGMFIFYGANRLLRAGINLAKPFISFKVGIVDDLDRALALVADDEAKNSNTTDYSKSEDTISKPYIQKSIQQYREELLLFLEEINWERKHKNNARERDPRHPFRPVFDAIELIKWEFDDLLQEQQKSEKKAKKAKTLAEKANAAKTEFLANMSHELRTPLNHIIGFTELVLSKNFGALNEIQEEYLGDVLQSSRHLHAVINDILDLSKVEAGRLELVLSTFNLAHLLEKSLVMVKEKALKHAIQLSLHTNEIPETIRADERKLKQVMYNLLSNAVKFTSDGGEVSVIAQAVKLNGKGHPSRVRNEPVGVKISVSDTGIGINPQDLTRIFHPFEQVENVYSRKFEGTGLGLPLSRNLIDLHGGNIWAESNGDGQGSSFHFVIPAREDDDLDATKEN